ncbi:MAG: hypothetical protein JW940_14910 [Polyangiaceae bacterium]|nr:hypothetical protein [Polyangiaceae bacterium]
MKKDGETWREWSYTTHNDYDLGTLQALDLTDADLIEFAEVVLAEMLANAGLALDDDEGSEGGP